MSMPNVTHPWSDTSSALFPELTIAPPATDAGRVAATLFETGFVDAAIAMAEQSGDATLQAAAHDWRQRQTSDAALAAMIRQGAGALVPSVSARSDGTPRFVVQFTDLDAASAAISREHGEHGVDSELRLFLDEVLQDGDRFVDTAPGAGFAALSAASGHAAASVIVLCEDSRHRSAIEQSARWSASSDRIVAREGGEVEEIGLAPAVDGATTIIHAGSAAAVAPLLSGVRSALARGEIGAVAWRCGRADEQGRDAESLQVAAAVLGVFGFQHFALADGDGGAELVPADAMASNEMIFSLSPEFLARFDA